MNIRKTIREYTALALSAALLCVGLGGCASGNGDALNTPEDTAVSDTDHPADDDNPYAEEIYTGDAALDNPRNQDDIGEQELLAVSFGTSFNDSRRLNIGGMEAALETAFPDWSVRRGFTSQTIIDHVKARDGVSIDNVGEALDRAVSNGVRTLVIQSAHLMDGFEYHDLVEEAGTYAAKFDRFAIGKPLLSDDDDFIWIADAIVRATAKYDDGETAICFMGHGTEAASNGVYTRLQDILTAQGHTHYYIGTVEAEPSVEDVLETVQINGQTLPDGVYKRVVLEPLMIVAGDHANNDMAGDEPDSWKSVFERAGYDVTCIIRGLGELPDVQALFVDHARTAIKSLTENPDGNANTSDGTNEPGTANTSDGANESGTANASNGIAGTANNGTVTGNVSGPVDASALRDGVYPITVKSNASMFHVTACELNVSGDTMTAILTMGGKGYAYVYPGTAQDAVSADDADYIPPVENSDGADTFTIPVTALNIDVPCAAYSRNRQTWYDRTLVFRAETLPADAFATENSQMPVLPDGFYTVGVTLGGGSGRASVTSPAQMRVENGTCTVLIEWGSPNYDYMLVDGETCLPVNTDGNAAFRIPLTAFDIPLTVTADTTAMSQPYEIEYTLTFDSSTIQPS